MKLITETIEDIQVITEEKGAGKDYKIRGIFLQGDIKNRIEHRPFGLGVGR